MNRRTVRLVLASILAVGAIGSVTVHGVWALFSSQTANSGAQISSGTMTMVNVNGAPGASTTLSGPLGTTTLASAVPETALSSAVPETTLAANVPAAFATTTLSAAISSTTATTLTVASATGFPTGNFTILIGTEQMTVIGVSGTTWTVIRGANGTTAATHSSGASVAQVSIYVSSATGFPTSGNYTILVGSEQMTVTAGQGTPLWTVTRAVNGTTAAAHTSGVNVDTTTISVNSATNFPASGPFTILVDSEQMTVTTVAGTTWTVTRGANSTTIAPHSSGASVDPTTISVASATNFPASGPFSIRVDNEVMTVTGVAGTAWTVTRGANGSAIAGHASGANVLQRTVSVSSYTGFPSSGVDYTVQVGSEKMLVVGGQGTATWTVTRAVDGTTPNSAGYASGTAVSTPSCKTLGTSSNVNTGCDAVFTWSPAAELYPSSPVTTTVAITDSGSLAASDLVVYMPSCLRAITPDAPFASTAPSISSFTAASTTGGSLVGGTTYYYEVTSVTAAGESVAGSESTYTPPTGTSTNQITLNWAAVSGATNYKIYRSTTEGGEKLLATVSAVTSYTDSSATVPSGSPPTGTGSGNPCLPASPLAASDNVELTIQETNASGTATQCWYPNTGTTCTADPTDNLSVFAGYYDTYGTAVDLGSGPAALGTRYFQIGLGLPATAGNEMQGTEAVFTLHWYALS